MTVIEIGSQSVELTRNQRIGNVLTIVVFIIALTLGLIQRESIQFATTLYINNEAGISAEYPTGWLIEEGDEFVFQVRDLTEVGFKTTIRIDTLPINDDLLPNNVLMDLSLQRSGALQGYLPVAFGEFILPNETTATSMEYQFISTSENPFVESVSIVVTGRDILVFERGQAILISFWADARTFEQDLAIFDRFLRTLDY